MAEPEKDSIINSGPSVDEPAWEAARWFYRHGGKMYGPVSSTDLRAAAHLGFLRPLDVVLRQGETHWLAARSLSWLFPAQPHTRKPAGP